MEEQLNLLERISGHKFSAGEPIYLMDSDNQEILEAEIKSIHNDSCVARIISNPEYFEEVSDLGRIFTRTARNTEIFKKNQELHKQIEAGDDKKALKVPASRAKVHVFRRQEQAVTIKTGNRFIDFRSKGLFIDADTTFEDEIIRFHKTVLAQKSSIFMTFFTTYPSEEKVYHLDLPYKGSAKAFSAFVDVFYGSFTTIEVEGLLDLFILGRLYGNSAADSIVESCLPKDLSFEKTIDLFQKLSQIFLDQTKTKSFPGIEDRLYLAQSDFCLFLFPSIDFFDGEYLETLLLASVPATFNGILKSWSPSTVQKVELINAYVASHATTPRDHKFFSENINWECSDAVSLISKYSIDWADPEKTRHVYGYLIRNRTRTLRSLQNEANSSELQNCCSLTVLQWFNYLSFGANISSLPSVDIFEFMETLGGIEHSESEDFLKMLFRINENNNPYEGETHDPMNMLRTGPEYYKFHPINDESEGFSRKNKAWSVFIKMPLMRMKPKSIMIECNSPIGERLKYHTSDRAIIKLKIDESEVGKYVLEVNHKQHQVNSSQLEFDTIEISAAFPRTELKDPSVAVQRIALKGTLKI